MQCGHGESGIKSTQPSLGGSKSVFISIINIIFLTALFNNRHTAITDTHSTQSSLTAICHLTTEITIYYL